MINSNTIREITLDLGADLCGIASIERFSDSPKGFHPLDIYDQCKSVIVFLKRIPTETIHASNLLPYTHTTHILFDELDRVGLNLCNMLEDKGIKAIPVPCDTPYQYWDADSLHGMGLLSMRHAAYLAGLGILGKNTLLINKKYGNAVYIGAVLSNAELESDPIATELLCPPDCSICLDSCPQQALDGTTVKQALCRPYSSDKIGRGFDIYCCNTCRQACPMSASIANNL